nr:hypothetical protein [Tanacetum cinerariifolium]
MMLAEVFIGVLLKAFLTFKNFPLPVKLVLTARRKQMPLPGRLHCFQRQEETVSQRKMAVTLNSYEIPANDPSTTTTNTTSGEAGTKSGRTVILTTEDMQKKKNDVKARTVEVLYLTDL